MLLLLQFQGAEYEAGIMKLEQLQENRVRDPRATREVIEEKAAEIRSFRSTLRQYFDQKNALLKDLKYIVYETNKKLKVVLEPNHKFAYDLVI